MTHSGMLRELAKQARRVFRGGSWYYYEWDCGSADRVSGDPSFRNHDLGFRVIIIRRQYDAKATP